MSDNNTLLGHLVPKLPVSTENAAVEALVFILNDSEAAKAAFNALIGEGVGVPIAPIARAASQATAEDGSRPDLVGFDHANEKRVIVEAKFWAALTENQPNQYLEQLPKSNPSVLLFVAPDARVEYLWEEVTRISGQAGHILSAPIVRDRIRSGRIEGTDHHMMVVSWVNLLDRMAGQVRDAAEPGVESDIRQLRGLAQVMDRDAFLPIRVGELERGPEFARRVLLLKDLVDPVVQRGREEGWADTRDLRPTRWKDGYGRYFRFSESGVEPWFGLYETLWAAADSQNTPLWVWFGVAGTDTPSLRQEELDSLRQKLELRLHENRDGYWAPVYLKTRVDRDQEVAHLAEQLRRIGEEVAAFRREEGI